LEENNIRIDLYNMEIKDNTHMIAVAKRIKKHEGFRVNVYDDHLGNKTGGYGHLMLQGETEPEGGYTKQYWEGVFDKDFNTAINGAISLVSKDVPPEVMGVMTEMVFQLGTTGVSKFSKTLEHIKNKDYHKASKEMLDSKWATQTKERAVFLSNIMSNIE